MEKRLIRAAEHLEGSLFKQFDVTYQEMAIKFAKGITRGGDPANYNQSQILDEYAELLESFDNKFLGIDVTKLPYQTQYFNFDTPSSESDEIKKQLNKIPRSSHASHLGDDQQQALFFERTEKQNSYYKELFKTDKIGWYNTFPEITYTFNKDGMRNNFDLDSLEDNKFIPVFGDSNTLGMGLRVEDLWYNKLDEELPIYNSGVVTGNTIDAFLLMKSMYKTKKFNKAYVCIPHAERWTGISDKGFVEGITGGEHYFLNQFQCAPNVLNKHTRQLYRWMALQCITNFCIQNDIELKMFDETTFMTVKWSVEQDLILPNWFNVWKSLLPELKIVNDCQEGLEEWYKYVSRDALHFGTTWHTKIAKYLVDSEAS